MSEGDKSKYNNVCILIINIKSITLEEIAKRIENCFCRKPREYGGVGHFVTHKSLTSCLQYFDKINTLKRDFIYITYMIPSERSRMASI